MTADGDLYMAGASGVVRVNIENASDDLGHIKMSVPYIQIDGKTVFPGENGEMRDKNDTGGGSTDDIDNIHRKQDGGEDEDETKQ